MKTKPLTIITILMLLTFSLSVYAADFSKINSMPHFTVLDWQMEIVGGGPPSKANIKKAKEIGIKMVVDLRTPEEGIEEERDWVRMEGMKYINIPVSVESLDLSKANRLARVLQDFANRPLIVHCSDGNRTAALYALYINRYNLVDPEMALNKAVQKGLRNGPIKERTIELLNRK